MKRQPVLSLRAQRWLLLAAATLAIAGLPAAARAQDPLAELRQELSSRPSIFPNLAEDKEVRAKLEQELKKFHNDREEKISNIIDKELKTFSQLRQALMLKEWADVVDELAKLPAAVPELVTSDAKLRARLADKFRAKVRRVVQSGDDDSKAAVANLITEMGITVRAAVPPDAPGNFADIDAERRGGFSRSMTDDIIRLTKAPSEFVRLHALRALGGMNPDPRRAAPVLAAELVPANDVQIRRVAADSLLRLVLVAKYLNEQALKSPPVRASRFDVLIADAEVARYAPTGLGDADAGVRERSAEALRAGANALTGMLQQPPTQGKAVARTIDISGDELKAMKEVLNAYNEAGPRLAKALADANADVRVAVVRGLEQLSDTRYRLHKDPLNVVGGKEQGQVFLVPPRASDPLALFAKGDWRLVARMIGDPDVRVRRAAVNFLEYFAEARPEVVGDLTRAIGDPDRFVRWSAARGIGYFTKGYEPKDAVSAVPALAKMLFDPDFAPRLAAAATLESMGKYAEAAGPELARAVHFGDPENRVAALYVIQAIGPEHSKALVPSITEALKNSDHRVRRAAAETLGKYGPLARETATIAALRRAMGDEDQEVRINASEALLQILADEARKKL